MHSATLYEAFLKYPLDYKGNVVLAGTETVIKCVCGTYPVIVVTITAYLCGVCVHKYMCMQ